MPYPALDSGKSLPFKKSPFLGLYLGPSVDDGLHHPSGSHTILICVCVEGELGNFLIGELRLSGLGGISIIV